MNVGTVPLVFVLLDLSNNPLSCSFTHRSAGFPVSLSLPQSHIVSVISGCSAAETGPIYLVQLVRFLLLQSSFRITSLEGTLCETVVCELAY